MCALGRTRQVAFLTQPCGPCVLSPLTGKSTSSGAALIFWLCSCDLGQSLCLRFASVCPPVKFGCFEPARIPSCSAYSGLIWKRCSVRWVFTGSRRFTVVPGSWRGGTFSFLCPSMGRFMYFLYSFRGRRAPPLSCGQRSICVCPWPGSFPSVELTVLP